MAGVNATTMEAYVRLVRTDAAIEDYRLPPGSIVRIATASDVDRAILFDGTCTPMIVNEFGNGNNTFAYGGQLFIGPGSQAGYSSEVPPGIGAVAARSDACIDAPTPAGLGADPGTD
jgi:hypothetical protein